ncbi:MAG: type transport system ATP-binding protein [Gaiellales bacterium]|nr:type transport system ATP-binding protein [Gaiellales bacterium]
MAEPVVEAVGVSKRFGGVEALRDVSVSVTERAVGLLGANGAGKSTLMRVMLGLVRPDAGTIRVLGLDAARQSWDVRRRLGYMPEHDCLPLGMTAADFVVHMAELRGLPHRTAVLRGSEALFHVGLEEERSRLISTFSVGMRQRTNLAQAIVHSPRLVILDEPTSGLDPAGREEMLQLVRRLSTELGIYVLMSSHVLEDIARTCDAVVVLREGRVAVTRPISREDQGADRAVRVRISGSVQAFIAAVMRRGARLEDEQDDVLVLSSSEPHSLPDAVRDAAAEAGVGLYELRPAGPTLEDALIEAMA